MNERKQESEEVVSLKNRLQLENHTLKIHALFSVGSEEEIAKNHARLGWWARVESKKRVREREREKEERGK